MTRIRIVVERIGDADDLQERRQMTLNRVENHQSAEIGEKIAATIDQMAARNLHPVPMPTVVPVPRSHPYA